MFDANSKASSIFENPIHNSTNGAINVLEMLQSKLKQKEGEIAHLQVNKTRLVSFSFKLNISILIIYFIKERDTKFGTNSRINGKRISKFIE